MDGVVETVDLVDARGVDVLGIQACVGATLETDGTYTHCAPSNASAWPPSGVALRPVEGAPLPRDPRDPTGILVGLRRQPGFAEGTVRAVRITYSVDTSTYQVVEPWSVRLTDDPPELQSPGSAS